MKLFSGAAALSNTTLIGHEVTFDPDASWLKFHLGISRYALYSRDDPAVPQLLKDMARMRVVNAGERRADGIYDICMSLTMYCNFWMNSSLDLNVIEATQMADPSLHLAHV